MIKYLSSFHKFYKTITKVIVFLGSTLFAFVVTFLCGIAIFLDGLSIVAFGVLSIFAYASSYLFRKYIFKKKTHSSMEYYYGLLAVAFSIFLLQFFNDSLKEMWGLASEAMPDVIVDMSQTLEVIITFLISSVIIFATTSFMEEKEFSRPLIVTTILFGYFFFFVLFFALHDWLELYIKYSVTFLLGFIPVHWAYMLWVDPIMQQKSYQYEIRR